MKKLLLGLLFLAVLTGGIFAQAAPAPALKIEGTIDAWWVPFQYQKRGDDSYTSTGLGRDSQGADAVGPRARLLVTGGNEFIGLNFELQFFSYVADTSSVDLNNLRHLAFGDNMHVWWKPFGDNMLQIRAGRYRVADLRGQIGDSWLKAHTAAQYDADEIFTRFSSGGMYQTDQNTDIGVLITSRINDLYIGVNVPRLNTFVDDPAGGGVYDKGQSRLTNNSTGDLLRAYARTQFAVGYTIQGVGLARAQWVGTNYSLGGATSMPAYKDSNDVVSTAVSMGVPAFFGGFRTTPNIRSPRIEAAFQVTALQSMGLMLDIGFKVPLAIKEDSIYQWDTTKGEWVDAEFLKPATLSADDKFSFTMQPSYGVSLGVQYRMDVGDIKNALNILARFDTRFAGSAEYEIKYSGANTIKSTIDYPFELNVHLWPTYDLGFIILGLDVGVGYYGAYKGEIKNDSDKYTSETEGGLRFGAGFFVQKNFGSGNLMRAGLAYSHGSEVNKIKSAQSFTVPVYFESRF